MKNSIRVALELSLGRIYKKAIKRLSLECEISCEVDRFQLYYDYKPACQAVEFG